MRWLGVLPIFEISYRTGTSQEMILKVYEGALTLNDGEYYSLVNSLNRRGF